MRLSRKVNLDDIVQKALLHEEFSGGHGWHTVDVSPVRVKARFKQFGYYYSTVLPIAKAWLNETQGGNDAGEDFSEDEADVWLKNHLRGVPVIDKRTGEQLSVIAPSKASWDTRQMAEFVDDVIALLKRFDKPVPAADKNWRETRAAAMAHQT